MANRTKLTAKRKKDFIKALSETGNVSGAARSIGVSRTQVYEHKAEDAAFAQEWEQATEEAADKLEREAWRRAVEGVEEPIYYQGLRVDTILKYSDSLLQTLLKANRPEKFKDRVANELSGTIDLLGLEVVMPNDDD